MDTVLKSSQRCWTRDQVPRGDAGHVDDRATEQDQNATVMMPKLIRSSSIAGGIEGAHDAVDEFANIDLQHKLSAWIIRSVSSLLSHFLDQSRHTRYRS